MIRAIIFDCFGVLYHGSLGHLFELTPRQYHDELADISKSSDYGFVPHKEYVQRVSEMTGKTTVEIESIMQADHVRNVALVEYMRGLRSQYKIGLLSNVGKGVMDQLFSEAERKELFDAVVLSSEVGLVKPQPEMYHLAAQRLGVSPEECLMIDDLQENIDGAIAAGMQGIVFITTESFTPIVNSVLKGVRSS